MIENLMDGMETRVRLCSDSGHISGHKTEIAVPMVVESLHNVVSRNQ